MSTLIVNAIKNLSNEAQFGPLAATSKSATGTSVDFTGIPSWVKRITVMFSGVSSSGTSGWLLQLGDSGGVENTGYTSTGSTASGTVITSTAGLSLLGVVVAADTFYGSVVLTNITGTTWTSSGTMAEIGTDRCQISAGGKALSDVLTQVRITTVNGTDTFDAGSINILYE